MQVPAGRGCKIWFRCGWAALGLLVCGGGWGRLTGGAKGSPLPVQATGTAQAPLQTERVSLPADAQLPIVLVYRLWKGIPVVEGTVGGSPERLMLDTGLNANAISPETSARLKLPALDRRVRLNLLDITTEAPLARIPALTLAKLTLENVAAATVDVPGLLSRELHPDAPTLWLGSPFLSAFQMTLDPGTRSIVLSSPQNVRPKEHGTVTLPVLLQEDRCYVKVSVPRGGWFLALIDTGTAGTLIPGSIMDKLKLSAVQVVKVAHPNGKEGKAARVIVPQMNLDRLQLTQVPAFALTADSPAEFDRKVAVLGMDFLRRFKFTLNYQKKQLALLPLPSSPAPPVPDTAGASAAKPLPGP